MRAYWLLPFLLIACTETQLVAPVPVGRLDAGIDTVHLSPGESDSLTVIPRDAAGNRLWDRHLRFRSSDTTLLAVDGTGHLEARAVGAGAIIISSEEFEDSLPFRVASSWSGGGFGDSYGPGCLLDRGGIPWCWGYGSEYSGRPASLTGSPTFTALDAGYYHLCGVATDSTAWCWGYSHYNEVEGLVGHDYSNAPLSQLGGAKVRTISAGYETTCAVMIDGVGVCYGRNDWGQLGDSSTGYSFGPDTVFGGHSWTTIQEGDQWTCGLDTAHQAWCWGWDYVGDTGSVASPSQLIPTAVAGTPTFESLVLGGDVACALTSAGAAWCWGHNDVHQTGHAGGQTAGAVETSTLFAKLFIGYNEVCGLDGAGAAWCWGHGGWTGDGTWESHMAPMPVLGGHRFVTMATGWPGFCGITSGGAAWCWGSPAFWNTQALVPRRVIDP